MRRHAVDGVLAALQASTGAVEVTGSSALAEELRARLHPRLAAGADQPDAVVETTGEADVIRDALRRVADLGTVVLAGPPPDGPIALDLYADAHVRGLTIVGVAPELGERGRPA